jgi:hypothetical protein
MSIDGKSAFVFGTGTLLRAPAFGPWPKTQNVTPGNL